MIINFVGKKYAGKSTAADFLRVKYKFEVRNFATKGKEAIAAIFDILPTDVDAYKEIGEDGLPKVFVRLCIESPLPGMDPTNTPMPLEYELSWREFMQRFFTESAQEHYGRNFWVDFVLPDPSVITLPSLLRQNICFGDGRFVHEMKRVREYNGYNVQILRDDPRQGNDTHLGEQAPPEELIDYVIDNNGPMTDFYEQIDITLNHILETENALPGFD